MLWGTGSQYAGFYDNVKSLLKSNADITHVLGFNEPDLCGPKSEGGSCVSATTAATLWQSQIEPLKALGVQLGAPATTQGGLWWLQDFFLACKGKCTPDFLPLHYYGDFPGLAGYIGLIHETYPNMAIWITEFARPNSTVYDTQVFYNQSVTYLDSLSYVQRYSYFGSFRADAASAFVGPNGTMLNDAGRLTDIGAWYLGMNGTGLSPESGAGLAAPSLLLQVLLVFVLLRAIFTFR